MSLLGDVVRLDLTVAEAETLNSILRFVGGDPNTSRRKHADSVMSKLVFVGVEYNTRDVIRTEGIRFKSQATKRGVADVQLSNLNEGDRTSGSSRVLMTGDQWQSFK